ncbi:MAG: hypothetical protein GXP31_16445 [Kiritimatiellaeota bacterium]|nr:hypothetical protein [Kiritimatiellota bacterium]
MKLVSRQKVLCLSVLAAIGFGGVSAAPKEKGPPARPFPVRGYHQHVFPDRQPMEVFHRRLETLARFGYNMVVFGMGTPDKSTITLRADGSIVPNGCSTEDLRKLVRHAVDLGLEPVFEMKFIGKQLPLLREVVAKYPDLVIDPNNRSTVLNAAFRMPDGRDAYSATALALVDYLLSLYPKNHPARYFFFGIDEFSADDMAKLAKKLGMTPPQAFAHCLNLGTDHVLARGVTPLIWGDVMLSPALGTRDHGLALAGYKPDPRLQLQAGGAYHSAFGKSQDHALHAMVNFLRDRDRIIVVDWHYQPSPTGEFPSVDYFQQVGFKDVWGAPWHNEINLRQFARYAAARGCGGMIATAWHDAYMPEQRLLLHFIIATSAAFFRDPDLTPPPAGPTVFTLRGKSPGSFDDGKRTGIVLRSERTLAFEAPVPEPITACDGRLLITPASRRGDPFGVSLDFEAKTRRLHGTVKLPRDARDSQYQVRFCYSDAASGFVYLKNDLQGFVLADRPPELPASSDPGVLVEGDFTVPGVTDLKVPFWLGGACAGPLGRALPRKGGRPPVGPRPGGLDMNWFDRVWFLPSDYFNDVVCRGMVLRVEAKMTGGFEGNEYCALLTKGSFHTGFRLLVGQDRHVLFQIAGIGPDQGRPLGISSGPRALPLDRWARIEVVYLPPPPGGSGKVELRIDGRRVGQVAVGRAMSPSAAVVGVGCEFRRPTTGPFGKLRPNFPGLIRRFSVRVPK